MASGNLNMKRANTGNNSPVQNKKAKTYCQYGEKCYRRNPIHFSEYSHPHLDKLYALQKDGEDIALPLDFKPKINSEIVVNQLQLYRDHSFEVNLDLKPTDKPKQQHNQRLPKVTASPSSTVRNKQNDRRLLVQNLGSPSTSKTDSQSSPTSDNSKLPQDRVSPLRLTDDSDKNDKQNVPRTDMRRLVHEPDSPPRASSYLQNSDKDAVPRTDIKNKLGSPSISEVRNTEKSSLVSGNNSEGNPVVSGGQASTIKKGFAARLAAAAPYNFFLTAIRDSPPTHREPLSVCFHQLLDPSMGDLDSSLQINFMVELDWLMEQYKVFGHENKPLFILYGVEDEMLENPKKLPPNIAVKKVKPSAFGHHHTKMSLFYYKDNSLRVVVSTANLISSDWYNRTQGVWVSPACPELPPDADTRAGESPSEFKADLLRYISNYHLPALQEWMSRLRRTDFSAIRVCFVASVPGSHRGQDGEKWGHRRLGHLLRKFAVIPSLLSPAASKESWPVISQCSSIGTLGGDPDSWMCGELRTSFSQKMLRPGDMPQPPPPFRVIYPSLRNVKNSHDDLLGGACLPYSRRTHEKQLWFRKFLFEWKSDKRHRSKAMPHIKTYSRVSPCGRHLSWFHLTSANLSKAAWGKIQEAKGKNGTTGLYIMSYEAGVLFLPKLLVNEQVFRLDGDIKGPDHNPPFPLPWDLPLSAYAADDEPFVHEYMD